ncbi:diguanylate cyclase [Thermomonas sp. S9]|uniref:tetratricopeptide repeat-containing diguanylate cyclase n=1 Tax=Thermomonas sp. S9 TaxID=2885203 RepID=UPI00216AC864|nr:diguanylate cyclase [Thermomonas sp. S9]MCR6494923.1 diguanylate cyclase [Thermomonas sp. S9]
MGPAPWLRILLLLLALLPAAAPSSASLLEAPPAPPSKAAQFDAVFQNVIGPGSMDAPYDAYAGWLEQLRILLPPGDKAREVQFRSVYCGSPRWKDAQQGLAYSQEAFRRALAAGDVASQGRALFCQVGFVQELEGTRRSIAVADRMVALLERSAERQLLGEALMLRGGLLSDIGEQARALMDFQRARAAFRDAGIDHEIDYLQMKIATAYRRMGDFSQAERYFTGSVARQQDLGDWERQVSDLIQLGYLYEESGELPKARASFERAVALSLKHESRLNVASARLGLASAQIAQGEFDSALITLAQARAGLIAEHVDANDGLLLLTSGQALAGKGEHRAALEHYRLALAPIEKDGNQRYLAMLYQAQSASEEALGQLRAALDDYKRYAHLQAELQSKMRLEQSRLLQYEYEIRRRDFENRRLQTEAQARQQQLIVLERERHWQILALLLGGLLAALLACLAWLQWRRSRRLRTLAMTDPLTGAASRLAIERTADTALAAAQRQGQPLSLLLLDLDYFKAVNDRHGHAAGDAALRDIVQAWQAQLRDRDTLGRIGGEEFAVVCAGADLAQARMIAQRLLDATRAIRLPDIDPALRMATSIGIAEARADDTRESLFARADAALYRAKQQGRDRVED